MSFFSRSKKEKVPTPQEAIQKIRDVEDLLSKKQGFLEKKINDELDAARKYGMKNKRMALQALKRKKRYEAQLNQIDGTLTTLEYQREVLENASSNAEVLRVMGDASKAFKAVNANLDVDKVHDMMDDIAEQQQLAGEISTAISNPVGFDQDIDEDDLLRELEELQDQDLEDELLNIPNAPSHNLPAQAGKASSGRAPATTNRRQNDEEEDLRRMADWANS